MTALEMALTGTFTFVLHKKAGSEFILKLPARGNADGLQDDGFPPISTRR